MQFQENPFGQMPQFGGMAGPGGFAGGDMGMPGLGGMMAGGMFGAPDKKKKGGFNPMMLSPLLYAFSQNPKIGLSMLSPGIGIANMLGAFK